MNTLNSISRVGGYPLCAETLQSLYDNAAVVNRLLSRLNLAEKTAIILQEVIHGSQYEGYAYIYYQGNDRVVKYTRSLSVHLNSARMLISNTNQSVTANGSTFDNAYTVETAQIADDLVLTPDPWKFYQLYEVIEPAIFEDKLSDLSYCDANGVTFSANPTLVSGAGNIFSRNSNRIRLKLAISLNATSFGIGGDFYFNIDSASVNDFNPVSVTDQSNNQLIYKSLVSGIAYPVNAVMKIAGSFYAIEAYIYNDKLYFKLGKMAADNLTANNNSYAANGTIYVNSEVLL